MSVAIATATFTQTSMSMIWPYATKNTEVVWFEIISTAGSEFHADNRIRNVSREAVDSEFKADLKLRRHLLKCELGCKDCVRFEGGGAVTCR